ncbi:MAG: MoxR family ATPase [Nanoarchaeota archaeon]|nr:MoxR family ATPase [Nanoarchaeota archaeon]
MMKKPDIRKVKSYHKMFSDIKKEISKTVIGQEEVLDGFLRGMVSNGHILVEGIPGIAKTLIVRTLAKVTGSKFSRIQFTADLLPTDITGLTIYEKDKGFIVVKGPIFSNFIIADEINRSPPKTQGSLLEAMQEKQVTIGKVTYHLPVPFFVMATQNPLESRGVYNLPEAQVDRFLFKLNITYPHPDEEKLILDTNITLKRFEDYPLKSVVGPTDLIEVQNFVKTIYMNEDIKRYIVKIVDATRNPEKYKIKTGKYVEWGSSPRASISLYITSKAEALLKGKNFVTPHHVKNVAGDVLRHRIILNYEGQAVGVTSDDVIKEILSKVPVP